MEGSPGVGPDTVFVLQRAKWQCDAVLRGEPGHPWGRFGAALTALGDVNGDRLVDVAICKEYDQSFPITICDKNEL